jgi:hypothetical protein
MMRRSAAADYEGPSCPHCQAPLDLSRLMTGMQSCASCTRPFQAARFAAPVKPAAVRTVEEMAGGAGTACASHPGNASTSNCQRCGVFMCSLCEIDADEMKLCPACFDRLSAEGALSSTRTSFRDYGRQAGMLALAGIPLMTLGLVIGPAAIYYSIRSMRQKKAMGETDGRLGAALSIVAGLLETGFSGFLLYAIVAKNG